MSLNKDLSGTELKHFQIHSTAAETDSRFNLNKRSNGNELKKLPDTLLHLLSLISLRNPLNFDKDFNVTALKHFQIHSTAVETDFPLNFNKDSNGNELRQLPDLSYTCRD